MKLIMIIISLLLMVSCKLPEPERYTITTPLGTYKDTNCIISYGTTRCDNHEFTGNVIVTKEN